MDRIRKKCNPVTGVGLGQPASCDLAIGPTYFSIYAEVLATAVAGQTLTLPDVLAMITLKANGNPQRSHTAVELNQVNTGFGAEYSVNVYKMVNGVPTVAALAAGDTGMFQVCLNLEEPWRKSYAASRSLAWPTAWEDGSVLPSFQLEFQCPNTGKVDGTKAYTINVYAETTNEVGSLDKSGKPIMLVTKWKRSTITYGAAGEMSITTLDKKDILLQQTFFSQTGDEITAMKVEKDNRTILELPRVRNWESLVRHGYNEAALSVDRWDTWYDISDIPSDGLVLDGSKEFIVTPTLGAAAAANKSLTLVSQVYGNMEL